MPRAMRRLSVKGSAVVEAGGGALKYVDGAELGDGAAKRIDAGRKGTA